MGIGSDWVLTVARGDMERSPALEKVADGVVVMGSLPTASVTETKHGRSLPSSSDPASGSVGDGHRSLKARQNRRLIRSTRILFFLFLAVVAALTSYFLYKSLFATERTFAESKFRSIADHAVSGSAEVVSRKRLSMATMSAVISETFRDEGDWPEVSVMGYDRIVDVLARTGSHVSFYSFRFAWDHRIRR